MRIFSISLAACLVVAMSGSAIPAERSLFGTFSGSVRSSGVLSPGGGGVKAPVAGYASLTAGECRGLGGRVVASTYCSLHHGTDICVTVDRDGVVRRACLTK